MVATPKRWGSWTSLRRMRAPWGCWRKVASTECGDVAFDDVVAEDDGNFSAVGEVFGESESVGDAAFAFLVGEGEFAKSPGFAVAEEFDEGAGVFSAGDDEAVGDAGVFEALDGVHDHGFVIDGEEVFVGDLGEGGEAGAEAAGEDDAFHVMFLAKEDGGIKHEETKNSK